MQDDPKTTALPRLTLILGGARSGKSRFAQQLAEQSGRSVAFIATATALDEEMRERIRRHQAERPAHWQTLEEPLQLSAALERAAQLADVLLLDCMTLWLANRLLADGHSAEGPAALDEAPPIPKERPADEVILRELETLVQTVLHLGAEKRLIIVSNEVGLGIVPAYPLGRIYRDLLGLVNQRLAALAERVYLMIAGLPVDLKRLQAVVAGPGHRDHG
jgi:adenosylcobinamide kinase/adenosylcobinamide-phosphate guanylyltransferase